MFDILNDRGVSYCYWSYHDDASGIYTDLAVLPDPADADQTIIGVTLAALASTLFYFLPLIVSQ